jgi:hypothetical protein
MVKCYFCIENGFVLGTGLSQFVAVFVFRAFPNLRLNSSYYRALNIDESELEHSIFRVDGSNHC